ncbi:MAG: ABC transporter substrate-binding protein [Acidobacteriota bacterium]
MTRRDWLALTAAGTACAPKKVPRGEQAVRVGVVQVALSSGPLFLGIEQGYFREEGLKIEAEGASVSGLHISALAAGKLDVCMIAMTPAIPNAVAQGAPVRMVSARQSASRVCGGWGQFYCRLSAFPHGLKDFHELKGKRIAYSTPGSLSDFALDVVLNASGMTRADIQAIAVKRSESVAALLAGGLDAIVQAGALKGIPAGRRAEFGFFPGAELFQPKIQTLFILFGERLRGEQRDVGLRFLRACNRGSEAFFGNKYPDFNRKWSAAAGDPDAPVGNCPEETANGGAIDAASVKVFIDWAVNRKFLEVPIAAETLIDSSLLRDLATKAPA